MVPHKVLMVQYLLASGINAYRGATQLAYVKPPEGRTEAENSKWAMEHIIYLPIHSGMPEEDIKETVERVIEAYHRLVDYLAKSDVPKPVKKRTA